VLHAGPHRFPDHVRLPQEVAPGLPLDGRVSVSNHSITFGSKRVASFVGGLSQGRAVGQVQAGWIVRRMTVFFIPLERTNPKPACSYIVRVPL
jgi:hypothetical protein